MQKSWYRDLFRIDRGTQKLAVISRTGLAVGVPLLGCILMGHAAAGVAGGATALFVTLADSGTTRRGRAGTMLLAWCMIVLGGTIGHEFGAIPYVGEAVVLLSACVAGWVSGSYPAIATIARFGAVATAAGVGMQISDPDIYYALLAGGVSALGAAYLVWKVSGIPVDENAMDWHTAMHRALAGTDAGPTFALCFGAAAALALLTAQQLGVSNSYWATLTTVMVMRREGVASLGLIIQYMAGTLIGIPIAFVLFQLWPHPLPVALLATAAAALARVGLSINPALGFAGVTVFLLLVVDVTRLVMGVTPHLLWVRLYDVAVGCGIALLGTLVASLADRDSALRRALG